MKNCKFKEWEKFKSGQWQHEINVRDFIQKNYTPYEGTDEFLSGPTEKTTKLWNEVLELYKKEHDSVGSVLDIDTKTISTISGYEAGYIDKDLEDIVGLQTDSPLKRAIMPFGGIRIVEKSCEAYGREVDPEVKEIFHKYRKTHNDGVFSVYTPDVRLARSSHLITGLPDGYGRGRIIGDYRRVALYGVDVLIEQKKRDLELLDVDELTEEFIRDREEISEQINALNELKVMASKYGFDISKPAKDSKEAVQWLYFAYLAAIKEQNGAAMSIGRTSTFLDIYFERDLKNGVITESEIQEIIDQFVIKLRLVRHLRTPDYDELFSGDPTWVTCSIGGMNNNGNTLVTKTSYRIVHTLTNLNPSPEPNITILWSEELPEAWKKYCAKISIETDAIQYENDDLMRPIYGSDYAIACCVSAMRVGKDMQFFGARCNLAKSLLYAINGGIDEMHNIKVFDGVEKIEDEYLDYEKVKKAYFNVLDKVAKVYSDAMNIIHYMHDKYAYEAGQMALHDTDVHRYMAYGIAGLSVATDSLSAIKYAKVKPIRNEDGITTDFEITGDFPKYGNDDDRVDDIAKEITEYISKALKSHKTYRDAEVTMSVLTITSNVVYGAKTGATPDGRAAGVPFAPGANPMHGRDINGAIASLNSVAKLDYENCCKDGVSNTFSIIPSSLGASKDEQIDNLVSLMDGYFHQGAHHLNVNVLNRDLLIDAMNNPEKYPLLTIRVSGYSVRFNKLTRKQQEEVISRTFHEKI